MPSFSAATPSMTMQMNIVENISIITHSVAEAAPAFYREKILYLNVETIATVLIIKTVSVH